MLAHEALVRGFNGEGAGSVLGQVVEENRYAFDQQCRVKAIELATSLGLAETGARLSINFMPVIDFAARLGLGESQPNSASVVIVTDINGVLAGFLVEAVCDILRMDDGMLQPPPDLGDSDAPRFVQGVITSADAIFTLLSIEDVLPEPSALAA